MKDTATVRKAKEQLVLGSRILANEGIVDGLGHLSVRNPENPNTFFQSKSISPEFMTMDDIMEISLDGTVIVGIEGEKPFGERIMHGAILEARPDLNCVFHSHPLSIIPFSVCEEMPLKPVMVYGSLFYNGFAYYDNPDVSSGTLIVSQEEGKQVAEALGDKYACLLRGHGLVTGAQNIPELVFDTILLIKNAEVQLSIEATGKEPKLSSSEEGLAFRTFIHQNALQRCWDYYVARAKKVMPDIFDLTGI